MNCQEVQLQLSDYLEKSIDTIRIKSIETHLVSCPFCRAEAHGLSDCIRQIADLPVLEPPAGFAQRVMAHAREIEPRRWQWLFIAFKSTVPIQAAAVALVAVLAVLLYQKDPRFKDPSVTELIAPRAPMQAEQKSSRSAENAPTPAAALTGSQDNRRETRSKSSAQPIPQTPRQSASGNALAKDEATVSQSIPSAQREKTSEARVDTPRRPPIQAQEVSTGRESRPAADALGIGALSRQPFRGGPSSPERARSPLSEPSADFEFIVRRRPPRSDQREGASGDALHQRAEADAAIAAAAAQQGVPAPASPASSIVEIRWFTVAHHHFEQFRKELAAEAAIDSEKTIAPAEKEFALKSARELLIKVIILPSER